MAAAQLEKGKLTELSSYSHYTAAGVGILLKNPVFLVELCAFQPGNIVVEY